MTRVMYLRFCRSLTKLPSPALVIALSFLLAVVVPASTRAGGALELGARVAPHQLGDAWHRPLRIPPDAGRPTVILLADRTAVSQLRPWVETLWNTFGHSIDICGVARLDAVPPVLRGMVRGLFRRPSAEHVALDWDGQVSRSFGYEGGPLRVVVLDSNHSVIWVGTGAAEPEAVEACVRAIRSALYAGHPYD